LLTRFRAAGSGRRWRIAGAAAVGAAVLMVGPVTAASAQTTQVPDASILPATLSQPLLPFVEEYVPWNNYNVSDNCLDSNANGNAYTSECNGGPDQEWGYYQTEYSRLTFNDQQTGRCLDSNYAGNVYTSLCDGNDTFQNWSTGGEGPAYTIQNYQTGLCLDSNANGNLYTNPCNWNNSYQNWNPRVP
jgi:serine/threonine-protein kinase